MPGRAAAAEKAGVAIRCAVIMGLLLPGRAFPVYEVFPAEEGRCCPVPCKKTADPNCDFLEPSPNLTLGTWPQKSAQNLFLGDIRAVINASSSAPATVQIWWRRNDVNPQVKAVVLTDSQGQRVATTSPPVVTSACGIIHFTPPQPGIFFAYYLPYWESGGGAGLHFHWYNCTEHDRSCVLTTAPQDDPCTNTIPIQSSSVSHLEYRPLGPEP
jgi:hypothetical protein